MKIKKSIISAFLLLVFTCMYGQDKIITVQNDTIICHITNISLTHINFKLNRSRVAEGILIPMNEVREYSLSSQKKPEDQYQYIKQNRPQEQNTLRPVSNKKQSKEPVSRLRIGVQGGGSYIISTLANSRDQLKDLVLHQSGQVDNYYKKLRLGIHAGADVHYFFSKSFGAGFRYSRFTSSARMSFTAKESGFMNIPEYIDFEKKDNILMNYVGPSFVLRQWLNKSRKFRLNEELSVGYLSFKQEEKFTTMINPDFDKAVYKSLSRRDTYGGNFQLSFEYYPIPTFSLGLNAGAFAAPIKSLKVTDGETTFTQTIGKKYLYNMAHVNASIGARLHF